MTHIYDALLRIEKLYDKQTKTLISIVKIQIKYLTRNRW